MSSPISLHDPFLRFDLAGKRCFLTDAPIRPEHDWITVMPKWLMDEFELYDKPFKLLDESFVTYAKLQLPCSSEVALRIAALNEKFRNALQKNDWDAISEIEIFQAVGVIMLGLIYAEIKQGRVSEAYQEEGFKVAPALLQRFRNLHFFMQSLIMDFEWDTPLPFSFKRFQISDEDKLPVFEHRNEINTLTFSMKYKQWGIVMCLQDLGLNNAYIAAKFPTLKGTLTEIQYSEISAYYYYSNYLLSVLPDFDFVPHGGRIIVNNREQAPQREIFKNFEAKTFLQVLEAFLKPWGYTKVELFNTKQEVKSFI